MLTTNETRDITLYGRQELARGECLAVDPRSELARSWPERITWLELGRPVAAAAGGAASWASLDGRTISRTEASDRAIRSGIGAVLLRALEQLELPAGHCALDFTGVPLTEPVLEAILALADRRAPVGLLVIAEPLDAVYLARRWR